MSRVSRWKDKLRGWKRIFLQNWALFKASKIGLIGLGIMLAFVILALSAPFMNLRDPMWWRAPDQDIVEVSKYWPLAENNSRYFANQPVTHQIAARIVPAALGVQTDRVYIAAGSRIYALDPTVGLSEWKSPGYIDLAAGADPNPKIVVDPLVVNFGAIAEAAGINYWVYVATASGNVYAMNDTTIGPSSILPTVVKIGTLDGPATGLAVFSGDDEATYSPRDMVAASSSKGSVYVWKVDNAGHHLMDTIQISTRPVHIAGQPMKGNGPYPLFSPAFYYTSADRTRPFLYVGSEDGNLTALNITNLSNLRIAWVNPLEDQLKNPPGKRAWYTAPVVNDVVTPPVSRVVVFAASNTGNISALDARTGAFLPGWKTPSVIRQTVLKAETGNLTQPYLVPASTNILVGSSSGYVYSINYVINDPENASYPMSVNWMSKDTTNPNNYVIGSPTSFGDTLVFYASNYDLGPAGPSPEDIGTMFALDIEDGMQSWSVTFNTPIPAPITAVTTSKDGFNHLFFGTNKGAVYSFSTTGLYLIPSEPSWIKSYPSGNTYILGLDNRGRDVFSQWVWGSRVALYVGFLAAFFSISIGTMMGLTAGYFGGRIEAVLMRFTDVILVIPGLPLIIALASVLGSSVNNLILVIALVGWPGTARVVRSQVLSLKERPFIESARVTGASHARIMGRHILPNVLPLAFLYMTFAVSSAILSEASLSFIGLGDINTVSWGRMLQDVTQSQALKAWWWLLPPGLAITLISLGFFLVGRAFDEIVNPRLRKR